MIYISIERIYTIHNDPRYIHHIRIQDIPEKRTCRDYLNIYRCKNKSIDCNKNSLNIKESCIVYLTQILLSSSLLLINTYMYLSCLQCNSFSCSLDHVKTILRFGSSNFQHLPFIFKRIFKIFKTWFSRILELGKTIII